MHRHYLRRRRSCFTTRTTCVALGPDILSCSPDHRHTDVMFARSIPFDLLSATKGSVHGVHLQRVHCCSTYNSYNFPTQGALLDISSTCLPTCPLVLGFIGIKLISRILTRQWIHQRRRRRRRGVPEVNYMAVANFVMPIIGGASAKSYDRK